MTKFKNSFCVKVISSIVVFTFLTLDFARAGSFSASSPQTLAPENAFQASVIDFNKSLLSEAPVLNAILSVADYLLEETKGLSIDQRLEGLEPNLKNRSSFSELDVQSKIKFEHVKFHPKNDKIVIIPYEVSENKITYVQIAFSKDISPGEMAGFKWPISDKNKYAVTILPKDYNPLQTNVLGKELRAAIPSISENPIAEIEIKEPATTSESNASPGVKKVVIKAITLSLLLLFVIPFFIWSCAVRTVGTISTPTPTSESRLAPKADISQQEIFTPEKKATTLTQSSQKPDTTGLTRVTDLGLERAFTDADGNVSDGTKKYWKLSSSDIKDVYVKLVYQTSDFDLYRIYLGGKDNYVGCMEILGGRVVLMTSYKDDDGNELWSAFGGNGYVPMSENQRNLEKKYGKYVGSFKGNSETGQFTGTLKTSFGKNFSIASDEKDVEILFDHTQRSFSTGMIQTSRAFCVNAVTGGQLEIHKDVGFFMSDSALTITSEFTVINDYNTGIKNVNYLGKAGEEWYVIRAHKDAQSGKIILEKGSQAKLVYDEFQLTTSDILINTGQSDIKIKQIRGQNKLKPGKAGIIFEGELCTFEGELLNGELCKAATQNETKRLTELINSLKALLIKNERVNETFDKMLPGYSLSKLRPTFLEVGKQFAGISRDMESVKLLSSESDFLAEKDLTKLETAIAYVSYARLFDSIADKLTQKKTVSYMISLMNMLTKGTDTDVFPAIRAITKEFGFSGLHAIAKVTNLIQNANTEMQKDILYTFFVKIAEDRYESATLAFTAEVQKIRGPTISHLEVLVRIIEFDFIEVLTQPKRHLTFFRAKDVTLNTDALKELVNVYHIIYGYPTGKNSTNNNGVMITPDIPKPDSTHNTVSDAVNRAQKPTNKTYALFESVTRDPNNIRTASVDAGNYIGDFLSENKKCELPPIDRNAATAGVIQSLEQTLTALDASDLTLPEEIETAKNKIKANLGDIGITEMLIGIGILAKAAKKKKQNLVIGIDPSWIPGYESVTLQHNAMNPLINELNSIEGILAKRGHDNVKVFINKDRETLNTWTTDMKKALNSPRDFSNLITIGDMITSKHIENTMLQGITLDKRPLLAEIDPINLMAFYNAHGEGENEEWQLDIDLLKFISITVDIATGKPVPDLLNLNIKFNEKLNKIFYYPDAIRVNYQNNRAKNERNKTTLRSL